MPDHKIAIIIPTILRDELLYKTVQSIVRNHTNNCIILIGDQVPSQEKSDYFCKIPNVQYYHLPYNCGLSYARNELVSKAKELGCDYCIIGADSIEFTESMKNVSHLTHFMYQDKEVNYDLIGFNILNRGFGWEAKINLIPGSCFELEFIEKKIKPFPITNIYYGINTEGAEVVFTSPDFYVWNCECVRNFFIARTDALLDVKWDDNLIMAEHEDFFWRFKLAGKKVGWTDFCEGYYNGLASKQDGEYALLRRKNWNEGQKRLRAKYNIKGWVKYINLKEAKE